MKDKADFLWLFAFVILVGFFLFFPDMGRCESKLQFEAFCDPNDPKSCVQTLVEGEKAPFNGQLLTFRRAAKMSAKLELNHERLQLKIDEATEPLEREIAFQKRLQKSAEKAHKQSEDFLVKQIDEALPDWHERPIFVASASVVVTLGVIALSVWIVTEVGVEVVLRKKP